MKRIRKILALMLAACMVLSSAAFSYAEEVNEDSTPAAADENDQNAAQEDGADAMADNQNAADGEEAPDEDPAAAPEDGDGAPADTPAAEDGDTTPAAPAEEGGEEDENTDGESGEQDIPVVQTPAPGYALTADPVVISGLVKAFHLDAARKYFTVAQIEDIIDSMAVYGFNTLELALGNDGMRFMLDDMSLTVGETIYASDDVKAAIHAGNLAYADMGASNELTEAEMVQILSYAYANGIQVIPLINTPGHMDAILSAATALTGVDCSYRSSVRTVDVTNATAVEFTKAVVAKYADFFASKGCKYFNIGADEYANDLNQSTGFSGLISAGNYGYFADYVNALCDIVIADGMTPIAFNDGIYYNRNNSVTFNSQLVISYWSSGWWGYDVASASYLAGKGHRILNTNGDWYYVLGAANGVSIDKAVENIGKNPYTQVMGTGTMSDILGCMVAFWCDDPSIAYTETEADNVIRQMAAFAAANPTIMTVPEEIDEPETIVDEQGTGIGVTIPDLTDVEINPVVGFTLPGYENVVAFDITPYIGDEAYTGGAFVSIPVPEEWDPEMVFAFVVTYDVPEKVTGWYDEESGMYTFITPHFSVMGLAEDTVQKTINLNVGGTQQVTVSEVLDDELIETADGVASANVQLITVGGEGETAVTTLATGTGYYIKSTDGKYLSNTANWVDNISDAQQWMVSSTNQIYLYYTSGNTTYYLRYNNNSWTRTSSTNNRTRMYFNQGTFYRTRTGTFSYTYSNPLGKPVRYTSTEPSSKITFTGIKAGTTTVTIGSVEYVINVTKKDVNVSLAVGATAQYTDSDAANAVSDNTTVATATASGNNLTIHGNAVGTATVTTDTAIYHVSVVAFDPNTVPKMTVEYWITNRPVTAGGATSMQISAGDPGVYGENGAAIADLVPATGKYTSDTMVFWKATRLAANNKQTTGSGVDKTLVGNDFTRIRYYDDEWAYFNGTTWTAFASGDQIVAYYLQETDVTKEITTLVVDWGPTKGNWSDLNYLNTKYVLMDYSVKYETGEEVPASFTTPNSLAFHCDTSTTKNNIYYRTIGMTVAVNSADYEVYLITATPTSDNPSTHLASTAAGNGAISYNGTEKVVWAATQNEMDNSGLDPWTSISGKFTSSIGGEPNVPGVEIYRQQGMKITYYVRAKVTEDALTVNYINETTNENFYNYNIAVVSGTTFKSNIALASPNWKANLANGSVVNSLGNTQYVSADLATMPAIGTSFRYSDYTCTHIERSEDGKTVNLYYTFNNTHSFIVDFGLPVNITAADLGISGDWTSGTVTNAKYGSATAQKGQGVTYTANSVLRGTEQLSLTLTSAEGTATHIIYLIPATSVYYEEGFASFTGSWSGSPSTGSVNQTVSPAHDSLQSAPAIYGYDSAYAGSVGPSNGTQAVSNAVNDKAEFTFVGTGIEVYANTSPSTGKVVVRIKNSQGKTIKVASIETAMLNGDSEETNGQEVRAYNVPIYSKTDLPFDTYTVTVTHTSSNLVAASASIYFDGFRVHGTLAADSTVYANDLEENPSYIELRDQVIAAYAGDADAYEQVYGGADATVAIVGYGNAAENIDDLLENGPKNEIYVQPGQSVSFRVNTNRVVELGMKALNAATRYTLNGGTQKNLSSSTDMFYQVQAGLITIANTGSGVLAITKIKVCDDPDAYLAALTSADIEAAVKAMQKAEAPVVQPAEENEPAAQIKPTVPTNPVIGTVGAQKNLKVFIKNIGMNAGFSVKSVLNSLISKLKNIKFF